jgi:predicted Zn-dependent peptidase
MYEHMMFKGTRKLGTTDYRKEKPYMDKIDLIAASIDAKQKAGLPDSDSSIAMLKDSMSKVLELQRKFIKKDEIWELYSNNGATGLNGWTSDDMTAYIVTLPKNKTELFYWIEADRMANPVLREFYSEREVVAEERRMRYENRPAGKYYEQLFARFYIAHPYRQPTIGWMSDIHAYTREKLENHVSKYYTPDNAIIVLVGNVQPQNALKDITRYFAKIPRAVHPKEEVVTREPFPAGETRFVMNDDAQPRIDILFHTPGYPHNDLYELDVVQELLSGKSGRLYTRLVAQDGLCTSVGAENAFRLQDGYFQIWASLKEGIEPKLVETAIYEEIKKLTETPPTTAEMERVKNSIRMDFITRLENQEGISDQLAWFERLHSWKDMLDYPSKIAEVRVPLIAPIVRKYLRQELQTIGLLLPPRTSDEQDSLAH